MLPTPVPFIELVLFPDELLPPPQSIPFLIYEFVLRREDIVMLKLSGAAALGDAKASDAGPLLSGRPWLPNHDNKKE